MTVAMRMRDRAAMYGLRGSDVSSEIAAVAASARVPVFVPRVRGRPPGSLPCGWLWHAAPSSGARRAAPSFLPTRRRPRQQQLRPRQACIAPFCWRAVDAA